MSELTVIKKESKIAPWGDRAEVREIAKRIQLMVPGGKKLSEEQALALAQGAVAHGLDPFNGEIWYIPGSGLMAGIKGLRKAARQQLDGNFWPEFDQINDPDERNLLLIPEGALAFRCIIRDSETIMVYAEAWKKLAAEKIPAEIIQQIIGKRPYTEGVGYLKKGESTRMDPVQCAMKRAEADAMKRRFDLPFAIPSDPNGSIIDGEWHEAEVEVIEETLEETPEEIAEEARDASDVLFGEAEQTVVPVGKAYPGYMIDGLIKAELAENPYNATAILNLFPDLARNTKKAEVVRLVTIYRARRGEELSPPEAASIAWEEWKGSK